MCKYIFCSFVVFQLLRTGVCHSLENPASAVPQVLNFNYKFISPMYSANTSSLFIVIV